MSITIILAACVMRAGELCPRPEVEIDAARARGLKKPAARRLAVAMSLLGAFTVAEFIGPASASLPWDAYLRTSNAQRTFAAKLLALPPADAEQASAEARAAQLAALESMIRDLERAVKHRPAFAAAHRQLGNRYLELFHLHQADSDNPMPSSQIRDAAIASQFRSAAELREWLGRAFGPHTELLYKSQAHAHRAVELSPLQGESYVRLADLSFLQGKGFAETDALLEQAVRVRPYDGDLLFEVGKQLYARGITDPGLKCWQNAFRVRGKHRNHIARCVAGELPFAAIIELFAPDWETLPEFWKICCDHGPTEVQSFVEYAEAQARREIADMRPAKAAGLWRVLAQMQTQAGQLDRALASLGQSYEASPDDFPTRRALGMALVAAARPDEAAPHLRWCLDRKPGDASVEAALRRTARDRLAARPASATFE